MGSNFFENLKKKPGIIAGIVVGIVVVIIAIIVAITLSIVCCTCRRKKKTPEEEAEEIERIRQKYITDGKPLKATKRRHFMRRMFRKPLKPKEGGPESQSDIGSSPRSEVSDAPSIVGKSSTTPVRTQSERMRKIQDTKRLEDLVRQKLSKNTED